MLFCWQNNLLTICTIGSEYSNLNEVSFPDKNRKSFQEEWICNARATCESPVALQVTGIELAPGPGTWEQVVCRNHHLKRNDFNTLLRQIHVNSNFYFKPLAPKRWKGMLAWEQGEFYTFWCSSKYSCSYFFHVISLRHPSEVEKSHDCHFTNGSVRTEKLNSFDLAQTSCWCAQRRFVVKHKPQATAQLTAILSLGNCWIWPRAIIHSYEGHH